MIQWFNDGPGKSAGFVLWASKPESYAGSPVYAAYRSAFLASSDGVGFFRQGQSREDGSWKPLLWDAVFYLDGRLRHWKVGRTHLYYDGPHCIVHFGPFCFIREDTDCEECRRTK